MYQQQTFQLKFKKLILFTLSSKYTIFKDKYDKRCERPMPCTSYVHCRTVIREIKGDLRKGRYTLYLWTRRLNIIKFSMPVKYGDSLPTKNSASFFCRN